MDTVEANHHLGLKTTFVTTDWGSDAQLTWHPKNAPDDQQPLKIVGIEGKA